MGRQGRPRETRVWGLKSSRICLGQGGIWPVFNISFKREFEKILASLTLPGHLITASIKQ